MTYKEMYDPSNWILVDFDGTLCDFTWPDPPGVPFMGAVEALRKLREAGFKIAIFTARAWPGWAEVESETFYTDQLAEVTLWLTRFQVPYDLITAEKFPALYIIDDRALTPSVISPQWWWRKTYKKIIRDRKVDNKKYGSIRRG